MKAKTYDQWRELGYRVRKGEHATGRDPRTGARTFTREQVDEDSRFDRRDNGEDRP